MRAVFGVLLCYFLMPTLITRLASAQNYRFETELGQLSGTQIANSVPGFSGTGYVTDFDSPAGTDNVQLQVSVPSGPYEAWVGYRSQFGQKGYDYQVNGESGSGMFDQSLTFSEDRAGFFYLPSGNSNVSIHQGWGYYDVDYVELRPYSPTPLAPVASTLNDPLVDPHTQHLMNYLTSQYGQTTLAGQQHDVSKNLPFPTQAYLNKSGGLTPAMRGSDLIEYSPSRIAFGADPRSESEQSVQWARDTGGVITMSWHWNAPADLVNQPGNEWWRGFYTTATTFDLPAALADPAGSDYQLILRDIDAAAAQLQKFQDAGVPVVWRPLHEAQGGWFWWGAHGPDTFKQLWNLMHDRLTNTHGLHNLIWEFTSSAAEGNHLDWYPGDAVVDMIGVDVYTDPTSSMSAEWINLLEHYNGRKMIALSETGTLPNPALMQPWGIEWSYFSPWTNFWEDFSSADLQATLGHEDVITLGELPSLPWSDSFLASGDFNFDGSFDCADVDGLVAEIVAGGNSNHFDLDEDGLVDLSDLQMWLIVAGDAELGPGLAYLTGDANLDGVVDGQDFLEWNNHKFTSVAAWCSGDFNADGAVDGQDFLEWNNHKFTSSDRVVPVPEPGCCALLGVLLVLRRSNRTVLQARHGTASGTWLSR